MTMARGVMQGWLDESNFRPAVIKGWSALESRIDSDGTVRDICMGTMCTEDVNYYINRPFFDNDTHGLFARLAGAMAISGANIMDAKIFTLANGMALDTFWIQDLEGKPFDGPQRLARLAARVELSLSNRLDIQRELDSTTPAHDRAAEHYLGLLGVWLERQAARIQATVGPPMVKNPASPRMVMATMSDTSRRPPAARARRRPAASPTT